MGILRHTARRQQSLRLLRNSTKTSKTITAFWVYHLIRTAQWKPRVRLDHSALIWPFDFVIHFIWHCYYYFSFLLRSNFAINKSFTHTCRSRLNLLLNFKTFFVVNFHINSVTHFQPSHFPDTNTKSTSPGYRILHSCTERQIPNPDRFWISKKIIIFGLVITFLIRNKTVKLGISPKRHTNTAKLSLITVAQLVVVQGNADDSMCCHYWRKNSQ